jgi:hypothetical protein
VQEEIKLRMLELGLTPEFILKKYMSILSVIPDKVNASDILKVCDTLMRLHGVETQEEQTVLKVGAIVQQKTPEELSTYIMELTTKTQGYLSKLRKPPEKSP